MKQKQEFSEFFRTASNKEKIRVFTKVAKLANRDQRKLFKKAGGFIPCK